MDPVSAQVRGKPWRMNACSLITPHALPERSTCAKRAGLACKDPGKKAVGHLILPPELTAVEKLIILWRDCFYGLISCAIYTGISSVF